MNGSDLFKACLLSGAALLAACAEPAVRYEAGRMDAPWEAKKPALTLAAVEDATRGGPAFDGSIRDAFVAEFQRLELPLRATGQKADAQLAVTILENETKTTGLIVMGFPRHVATRLKLRLALKSPRGKIFWSDEVTGHGEGSKISLGLFGSVGSGDRVAREQALANVMKQVEALFVSGELPDQIAAGTAGDSARPAPASDVDQAPDAAARTRRAHALVIGVERYKADLPGADFAAGDAQLVGKYLAALGFPRENVVTLVNDGASRGDIEKYVERWLPDRVRDGDEVFVYFSGHGSPNPVSGDAYLVPFDGDPTYLDQTAYPISRLYASLAKLPTKDVTVVLDSCFSGAGGRSVIAKGARPLVNARLKTRIPGSLTVLTAAAANQISQSYQDKGHGLFTYFLLKALKKQAGRGAPDFRAAFDETAPQVTAVARQEYNSEQVPQWQGAAR